MMPTDQVPNKLTEQVSESERKLIIQLGDQQLSAKEIMEAIGLKHRPTLLYNYIEPAINDGIITLLYPKLPSVSFATSDVEHESTDVCTKGTILAAFDVKTFQTMV